MNIKKHITGSKHGDILYFFELIIASIENGDSLRDACENRMPPKTFYVLIKEDECKQYAYACACSLRDEKEFEEIKEIAEKEILTTETTNSSFYGTSEKTFDNIARSKLIIDSRKWLLAKRNPKKYGDKIENTVTIKKAGEELANETYS